MSSHERYRCTGHGDLKNFSLFPCRRQWKTKPLFVLARSDVGTESWRSVGQWRPFVHFRAANCTSRGTVNGGRQGTAWRPQRGQRGHWVQRVGRLAYALHFDLFAQSSSILQFSRNRYHTSSVTCRVELGKKKKKVNLTYCVSHWRGNWTETGRRTL